MPRPVAGELLEAGWLPPKSAAAKLGIPVFVLLARAKRGEIKRRELAPGTQIFLYQVSDA